MDENLTAARQHADLAREALRAAELLLEHGLSRSSIDRSFYAAFHAASALLASRGIYPGSLARCRKRPPGGFRTLTTGASLPTKRATSTRTPPTRLPASNQPGRSGIRLGVGRVGGESRTMTTSEYSCGGAYSGMPSLQAPEWS